MLLENGILKAKYGELVESTGKIFKQNLDGSDMPAGLDGEDAIEVEETGCLIFQLYDTTAENTLIPIITSGEAEIQVNYDAADDTTNNVKVSDKIHYDTTSAPVPFYWCGNETGVKYFVTVMMEENTDSSLLNAWAAEESKWFMVQIDMNPTGFSAVETIIGLPSEYFENEKQQEAVSIQINAATMTPYKLPATALNVGTGLKINENTNKLSLSFGEYKNTEFVGTFGPGTYEKTPSTKALGNLYCWYSDGVEFQNWEENSYPQPYSNRNIINSFYSKGSKSFNSKLNLNPRQNYQTTLSDEYYTIPFYFDYPINIMQNPSSSYQIELKEMPYENNALYTMAAMALDTTNPTANIFYSATINTNDDVSTIMNNGAITPINNEEPAILFVLLDQPLANQVFIWAFSNTNTLEIDSKNGKVFVQGEEYPTYTQLPPNWLNAATCSGSKNSIVLGEYCQDSDNKNHHQFILGKFNNPNGDAYFQIGNGSASNKKNIFEVNDYQVSINGDLSLNGQPLTNKSMITNPGTANSIDSSTEKFSDIIDAYNDLVNKYNNLINNLQNAGYMSN